MGFTVSVNLNGVGCFPLGWNVCKTTDYTRLFPKSNLLLIAQAYAHILLNLLELRQMTKIMLRHF